jgi:hypothetical protein
MRNLITYAVVLSDGGALTYESTSFGAAYETDALRKAKDWARSLESIPENAWLQLTADCVGVSIKPGEF